ncbi:hypothetical protein G6O69_19980 [Pseudenhygromyxa sp. WMMC2535]|uniref:hypothetical protein n=1 Tax=Pseudenhygromyxa sp. WMMC2535 TaxID=2712867 RepID=UPI001595A4DA|nr:hypothetical protein [Pseudenhygromyxa sp. WMMC2535]NVB40136.1 hypothetical protein [Pseudenhygromyxa sp. WMMC2535]
MSEDVPVLLSSRASRLDGSPCSSNPFSLGLGLCLGLGFGLGPSQIALAAPETQVEAQVDAQPEPPPVQDPTKEAKALFRRGQAKYETADYKGAIELWTDAYTLVDPTPENASIKALLIYNLAQAHVKAFELDEDVIHLKQAQQLLETFKSGVVLLYEDEADQAEEARKIDARIAEIDARLAEAEAQPEPEPEPEPPPPALAVEPEPRTPGPAPRPGAPLIGAGATLAAVGLAFGGIAIAGAVIGSQANDLSEIDYLDFEDRQEAFRSGSIGNGMAVSGLVIGGLMLPTGIALIAVGVKRNKRAANLGSRALVLPSLGPRGAGLSIQGRF